MGPWKDGFTLEGFHWNLVDSSEMFNSEGGWTKCINRKWKVGLFRCRLEEGQSRARNKLRMDREWIARAGGRGYAERYDGVGKEAGAGVVEWPGPDSTWTTYFYIAGEIMGFPSWSGFPSGTSGHRCTRQEILHRPGILSVSCSRPTFIVLVRPRLFTCRTTPTLDVSQPDTRRLDFRANGDGRWGGGREGGHARSAACLINPIKVAR